MSFTTSTPSALAFHPPSAIGFFCCVSFGDANGVLRHRNQGSDGSSSAVSVKIDMSRRCRHGSIPGVDSVPASDLPIHLCSIIQGPYKGHIVV